MMLEHPLLLRNSLAARVDDKMVDLDNQLRSCQLGDATYPIFALVRLHAQIAWPVLEPKRAEVLPLLVATL